MSWFAGADTRRYPAFALLMALLASGCNGPDQQFDVAATEHNTASLESIEDSSDTPLDPPTLAKDPFLVFGLSAVTDAPTTNHLTNVWVHNASREPVVVQAEAGAGRVAVDTVAPSDSVQVTIDTRADSVRFIAETLDGAVLGQIALPMGSGPQKAAFPR